MGPDRPVTVQLGSSHGATTGDTTVVGSARDQHDVGQVAVDHPEILERPPVLAGGISASRSHVRHVSGRSRCIGPPRSPPGTGNRSSTAPTASTRRLGGSSRNGRAVGLSQHRGRQCQPEPERWTLRHRGTPVVLNAHLDPTLEIEERRLEMA